MPRAALTRPRVVMGLMFFPRGGSAQVARAVPHDNILTTIRSYNSHLEPFFFFHRFHPFCSFHNQLFEQRFLKRAFSANSWEWGLLFSILTM
jgi:hypothetical protein